MDGWVGHSVHLSDLDCPCFVDVCGCLGEVATLDHPQPIGAGGGAPDCFDGFE